MSEYTTNLGNGKSPILSIVLTASMKYYGMFFKTNIYEQFQNKKHVPYFRKMVTYLKWFMK